jgi:hypothetical protein
MSSKTKTRQDVGDQTQQILNGTNGVLIPVITLRRYCEITGETAQAVHDRRRKGDWVDGKHCYMKRRRLWIDVSGVATWVRSEP